MNTSTPLEIDPRIYALYDEYCHGAMDRREFLAKASALAVGGMAMAQALFPRYANAQTISFTDPRINASWPAYEASLKAQTAVFQAFQYEGTQHGFHNNSTPRFQQAAADLSWRRTLALFQRTLKT